MCAPRYLAVLTIATLVLAAGCRDSPSQPSAEEVAVLQNGGLVVRGDDGPSQIHIVRTVAGVRVEVDGEELSFPEPVRSIEVEAGDGNNVVRYEQDVVADLDLSIVAGEGDDEVHVAFEPDGSGDAMAVAVVVDTGAGTDLLDFGWDGQALPELSAAASLEANGMAFLPEVADEVIVSFESGDPDRPIVVGGVYNPRGAQSGAGPDAAWELTFEHVQANAPPGSQVAPSQTKVIVLGMNHSDLDFVMQRASAGEIQVNGTGLLGGAFTLEAEPRASTGDGSRERWIIGMGELAATGETSLRARPTSEVESLVLAAEGIELQDGATADVRLEGHDGPDAMLVHLFGLSGAGVLDLVADGGAGDDFLAVLLRDVAPEEEADVSIQLLGGDGDEILGLSVPESVERDGPVLLQVGGGAGSNTCYLSDQVEAVECGIREGIGEGLLELLDEAHGKEFSDEWSTATLRRFLSPS